MNEFEMEKMKWSPRSTPTKGPMRLCKFCILAVLFPICVLCIPLYMRFLALRPHILTLSPTDMKLLNQESKVSTVWCKAQTLRMNSSFNAYLLPEKPKLHARKQRVKLERQMILEDDTKEFWGFYLLVGSKVRVSACARFPGGNIIVVRGTKDASRCAWLGELDSEEESDEISNEFELEDPHEHTTENVLTFHPAPDEKVEMDQGLQETEEGEKKVEPRNSQELTRLLFLNSDSWSHATKLKVLDHISQQLSNKTVLGSELVEILNNKIQRKMRRSSPGPIDEATEPSVAPIKTLVHTFNRDDLENDMGGEETDDTTVTDDGDNEGIDHLQDTGKFDQHNRDSKKKDKSNEEVRSSWSSSEEALLKCEGLIHQFEFLGNKMCSGEKNNSEMASSMDIFQFNVTKTGFYYFIFSNENEIRDNFLAANFEMQKTFFDISQSSELCTNSTECQLPLTFWSHEHIVIEVPKSEDVSECDTEGVTNYHQCHYVVRAESVCQPRGAVYMVFLILVPVIILLFAYI